MIYTNMTKTAIKLCFEAHKEQVDKGGIPYVFHPFYVAEQMETEEATVVALLHDIVEDTEYTLQDLRDMGFSERVIDAISLLTHDRSEPYLDYIKRIKKNPIARAVKIEDLRHNSNLYRLSSVDEKAIKRIRKYQEAINILKGI